MDSNLNGDQLYILSQRIEKTALLFGETFSEKRMEYYIDALLRAPHLRSFERIMRAIDMAEWQLRHFPMPSDLNSMFQH